MPLLNLAEYPFESLEAENKRTIQVCFSIYYRHGFVISENSQRDEWLYIIKSGSCKLVKRLHVDTATWEAYCRAHSHSQRDQKLNELVYMLNMDKHASFRAGGREIISTSRLRMDKTATGMKEVFLELPKLKEGDVFGLNDTLFDQELDGYKCQLMLISEGVEVVQVSRRAFLKHLTPQAWFKLRVNSSRYPNDEYFVEKYFSSFIWKDFTRKSLADQVRKDS